LAVSVLAGFTISQVYNKMDGWKVKRELAVWDYVKRHPQDFPEVFNGEFILFIVFSFIEIQIKPNLLNFSFFFV
jgi:hypothetical protein